MALALGGCVVPPHMNVTNGLRPDNIDKEVRFRATYYFRAFDYCWKANDRFGPRDYQSIIPETDTLYRFRMTGKASALGNRIKFESGTIPKDDIEPFGKTLRYDDAAGGFRSQSAAEVDAQRAEERADRLAAAQAAERAAIRALVATMLPMVTTLAGRTPLPPELAGAVTLLQQTMQAGAPPLESDALAKAIDTLKADLPKLVEAAVKTGLAGVPEQVAKLDALLAEIDQRVIAIEAAKPGAGLAGCNGDGAIRRGFVIMGPEGMRPFNQNERVVMAMYSSAEPLIESLQEYSSHMLAGQPSTADTLLPLAQAAVRLGDARRAIEAAAVGSGSAEASDAVFAAALKALGAKDSAPAAPKAAEPGQ